MCWWEPVLAPQGEAWAPTTNAHALGPGRPTCRTFSELLCTKQHKHEVSYHTSVCLAKDWKPPTCLSARAGEDLVTGSSNNAQAQREGRSQCTNVERCARQAYNEKARSSAVCTMCYHVCDDEGDNTLCVVLPAQTASSKGDHKDMIQQVSTERHSAK